MSIGETSVTAPGATGSGRGVTGRFGPGDADLGPWGPRRVRRHAEPMRWREYGRAAERARGHGRRVAIGAAAGAVGLLLLLVGVAACGGDDTGGSASPVDADGSRLSGLVRTPPLRVGELSLPDVTDPSTDADPAAAPPFVFRAEAGGLLAVYFGYTQCPDLCPTTFADLRKARSLLGERGERFGAAFVTIDPVRDTPDILRGYIRTFFADGHAIRTLDWDLLRGVEDRFLASSKITVGAGSSYQVSHTANTYVVDEAGTVVVEWPFGTSSKAMAADLDLLMDAMGVPEAGTPVQP